MMPGMLTRTSWRSSTGARGKEFDRLFLTFMIQHHKGAITMVNALFARSGRAGEGLPLRLVMCRRPVYRDPRMQKMLAALLFQGRGQ